MLVIVENRNRQLGIKFASDSETFRCSYVFNLNRAEAARQLLKYVDKRNGAQVIYQCKSLTYLKVNREDHTKLQVVDDEAPLEVQTRGVKSR